MRRRAILMIAEGERPHPGRANGRGVHLNDAPDDSAIGEGVEIVIVPLAFANARRPALVIRTTATSISCLPARIRSGVAVASPVRTSSTICATVNPCARMIASVAPSREAASNSSAQR